MKKGLYCDYQQMAYLPSLSQLNSYLPSIDSSRLHNLEGDIEHPGSPTKTPKLGKDCLTAIDYEKFGLFCALREASTSFLERPSEMKG